MSRASLRRAPWRWMLLLSSSVFAASCSPENSGPLRYVDHTRDAGIDFVHENGGSGEMFFVETNGSGALFFDADDDGRHDLYVVQAGALPGFDAEAPINRLYRGVSGARFEDVTEQAGVGDAGYGMGAVAADLDGDGRRDLFVYNWGPNVLYKNLGELRFEDHTDAAGLGPRGVSGPSTPDYAGTACVADFDRDGDLDLFVGNYVAFRVEDHEPCARPPADQSYCSPDVYPAQRDCLFENDGAGGFIEVARASGIRRDDGKALGALACDFDDDGDVDLFVANDSTPNHAYRNDSSGGLSFTDVSSGVNFSYDRDGRTQGSMGICAADIDGDLDFDLVVTNFAAEANALYVQDSLRTFEDEAHRRGIGRISFLDFGWGIRFFDFDRDTHQDLLVVNGHLHADVHIYEGRQEYAQATRLFANDGAGRFQELSVDVAGPFFEEKMVGRGLAVADLESDGDLDFFVNMNDHRARLARGVGSSNKHWIGLQLVGRPPNRDAIGARVVLRSGGREQIQEVRCGGSFASQHDLRLLFGLDEADHADVEVRWPDGTTGNVSALTSNRYHILRQE